MQIKPDLCNINPDDLDEDTIRNMHAIGINFVTRATNKYKPYETHATKKRKWRNYYFQSEKRMMVRSSECGGGGTPPRSGGSKEKQPP